MSGSLRERLHVWDDLYDKLYEFIYHEDKPIHVPDKREIDSDSNVVLSGAGYWAYTFGDIGGIPAGWMRRYNVPSDLLGVVSIHNGQKAYISALMEIRGWDDGISKDGSVDWHVVWSLLCANGHEMAMAASVALDESIHKVARQ